MMKYAGMIILIISTTAAGAHLCDKSKKRIIICNELISFCNSLLIDLDYRVTPAKELVESALSSENIRHLNFISSENILNKKQINSLLSENENNEISQFMYSLGKTDLKTQRKMIENFKELIKNSRNKYSEKHKRDSKLYLSFGMFFGIVFSL